MSSLSYLMLFLYITLKGQVIWFLMALPAEQCQSLVNLKYTFILASVRPQLFLLAKLIPSALVLQIFWKTVTNSTYVRTNYAMWTSAVSVPLYLVTVSTFLRSRWTHVSLVCVCRNQNLCRITNLDMTYSSVLHQKDSPSLGWLQIG